MRLNSFEMATERFSNTNGGEVSDDAQVTAHSAGRGSVYVVFT